MSLRDYGSGSERALIAAKRSAADERAGILSHGKRVKQNGNEE